jgi:phospholipid/cholesterol/gamma-HCH transport system ATP-binding protein
MHDEISGGHEPDEPRPVHTSPRAERRAAAAVIEFKNVTFAFEDHVVLDDLSFSVPKGSTTMLLGASGVGKSVVLKLALGLLRPDGGTISVNGERIDDLAEREMLRVRSGIGISFQENALFDSLTVAENVGYRLYEETDMPLEAVRRRVEEILAFIGIGETIDRMPSELSGGQRRRVGIARAMASRPGVLLFDDPTTGLDPIVATTVDDEIIKLRDLEHVTSIIATHQIRDAFYIGTHEARREGNRLDIVEVPETAASPVTFMVLHQGGVKFRGSASELLASEDPYLKEFLFMTLPPW